jgi:hypothetical protein
MMVNPLVIMTPPTMQAGEVAGLPSAAAEWLSSIVGIV